MIDKDEYIKRTQEQVTAHEKAIESGLSKLRSAQNSTEYKTALQAIPSVKEVEDVRKGMQLLTNKQEDTEVRLLILRKARSAIGRNTEYIRDCLLIVQDTDDQVELRRAILSVLGAFSFGSREFVALRPEYMTLLRSLLDDHDALIRERAAEELAKEKDEYVQRRLLAGLAGREEPIVPTAKAIQLLGYDIHAEHYPVVRRILEDPRSDETTKVEAIHVLGNDAQSRDLLTALMTDKQQPIEVRMTSATAMKTSNPEYFTHLAKSIVLDEQEEQDLRAVCLNALMHQSDPDALYADDDFVQELTKVRSLTTSEALKQQSTGFLTKAMRHKRKG
jgi:hypothetical protein